MNIVEYVIVVKIRMIMEVVKRLSFAFNVFVYNSKRWNLNYNDPFQIDYFFILLKTLALR